jgi:hypothetical protein
MLQDLRWWYFYSSWQARTHGDGVQSLLVLQDRNQNVQRILWKTFQITSLIPLTVTITSNVTAAGDPSADGAHRLRTSTPKPSTVFGRFKQAVSTMKRPGGRVCCRQYAGRTENAMEKGRQRETMCNVRVITYAGMELKYEWNVRKGRHSMLDRVYAMNLKTLIVMILNI